jgi:hypothetical protein
MSAHMHKYLSVLIRETLKHQWGSQKQVPLDIAVHHLSSSLLASLTWWVDHNLKYPPNEMNDMYRNLTKPAIDSLLKHRKG